MITPSVDNDSPLYFHAFLLRRRIALTTITQWRKMVYSQKQINGVPPKSLVLDLLILSLNTHHVFIAFLSTIKPTSLTVGGYFSYQNKRISVDYCLGLESVLFSAVSWLLLNGLMPTSAAQPSCNV